MLTLLQLHMELLLSAMRSFRNLNFSLNRYRVSEFLTAASGLGHKSSACNTWLFEIFTGDTREHFGKYGMDMREFSIALRQRDGEKIFSEEKFPKRNVD